MTRNLYGTQVKLIHLPVDFIYTVYELVSKEIIAESTPNVPGGI
jgi:hypothetical protein